MRRCQDFMKYYVFMIVFIIHFISPDLIFSISLVPEDATKRVFVPHQDIGNDWWQDINYDDSGWSICEGTPGGIGYEKSSGYEHLISLDVGAEMHIDGGNPNTSCFIRIPFTINDIDLSTIILLQLKVRYDDGFKAYLNGKKVAIANAPATASWNSATTTDHEANAASIFDISKYISFLVPGQNFLAIHGMNVSTQSSDFLITAELVASDNRFGDFPGSKLPLILINADQPIPDPYKITADMKVINNKPGKLNHPADVPTDYNGKIGIEIRGAYSSTFPQKPYSIETRDESGNNLNVSILGMPAENDWSLITNYNEKSLVRSTLAFDLYRQMGRYAPRAKLCEVFVNSEYRGIYVFTEKIKRDKNRVDIATLRPEENTGDDLTGGYIIKIDYFNESNSWLSRFRPMGHPNQEVHFVYYYPKPDEITDAQKSYIQGFIEATELALHDENFWSPVNGYRKYMNEDSFIDYFILSEVSRNVDGYKKSRFFYKDKDSNGGLLHAGPIWDFDWAWKNIGNGLFGATDGSGWGYEINKYNPDIYPPGWYLRLIQDGYFTNKLIDRYFELRSNVLNIDNIYAHIDSVKTLVTDAQERHFELWPIAEDYIAPEPGPPSHSYDEEITKLKDWIRLRLDWIDNNIPKLRDEITVQYTAIHHDINKPRTCRIYPNPAVDHIIVESNPLLKQIQIYNVLGQLVSNTNVANTKTNRISVGEFPSGLYFIKLVHHNGKIQFYKQMIY